MSISVDEFTTLQTQFLELRTQNYELQEKNKIEINKLNNEIKKLNDIINKSKKSAELAAVVKENESLVRNLQQAQEQNREQQEALRTNIKSMYQSNQELQNMVDQYKEKEKRQQREAQITKTLEENHHVDTTPSEFPNFDIDEASKRLTEDHSKEAIFSIVQNLWKEQMNKLSEDFKANKDKKLP